MLFFLVCGFTDFNLDSSISRCSYCRLVVPTRPPPTGTVFLLSTSRLNSSQAASLMKHSSTSFTKILVGTFVLLWCSCDISCKRMYCCAIYSCVDDLRFSVRVTTALHLFVSSAVLRRSFSSEPVEANSDERPAEDERMCCVVNCILTLLSHSRLCLGGHLTSLLTYLQLLLKRTSPSLLKLTILVRLVVIVFLLTNNSV